MHLSRRLAIEGGYIITFVNSDHNHARVVQSQNISKPPLPEGAHLDIRFASIPDGMPEDCDRMADIPGLCKCIETEMAVGFEKLMDKLMKGPEPVTLILSDVFVLHTQDMANKYNIPRVGFWTQCAASFAIHLFCARGYHPPPETYEGERVITCIPGAPPLKLKEMLTFLQPYDPADFMFYFFTAPFLRLNESKAILLNTFGELEHICLKALQKENVQTTLYTIGPILPPAFFTGSLSDKIGTALWHEDYDCLKWLDKQPPSSVVYVAFGSITVLTKEVIAEFAHALENSGLSFLWVLRPGMIVHDGSSSILPEGFNERTEKRGLVITWAPQLHVLTHPSVGGFLTHGGWNSTLEGIAAGQPMVGFPYFTDQMLNCRCIEEEWKVGKGLEPDEKGVVSRYDIEKQLKVIMGDEKIREKAKKFKEAAKISMQEGGSSVSNLSQFISESLKYLNA